MSRDHAHATGQLKRVVQLISAVWKLALPPKPTVADDPAAFERLPMADASGSLTQLGVIGWLYLDAQTGSNASGSARALAPYAADPDGEKVRGNLGGNYINVSFTGGVTAIVKGSTAAFSAAIASFAAARTAVAEPLSLAVLEDTDNYQKVYEEATASTNSNGGACTPVLDKLDAAVAEAKGAAPPKEEAAKLTVDPDAPDPAELGYAMHVRRMAAPTALFLYLLASMLIDSTPEAEGAYCIPGPIKGLQRMVAKLVDRYSSFEPCRDVARCTVHFPTLDGIAAFLLALVKSGLVYILRVKNRFDAAYDALPAGGYRDLQLLLLLPDGGGTVLDGTRDSKVFRYVELQLNLAPMVEIKNGQSALQAAQKEGKKKVMAAAAAAVKKTEKKAKTTAETFVAGLLEKAGHEIFNFARAVDAFSVRTLRYKGAPNDQVWQAIKVGAMLEVDFNSADFSAPEEQGKLMTNVFASETCRVRILG